MPIAFVTGASRGIGKAISVHLANAGYDIALTARTLDAGETRARWSMEGEPDTSPWPGSLTSTAALVERSGRRSLTLPADLTQRSSILAAATTVLDAWGPVDVLVNNGRWDGPGFLSHFMETPLEVIDLQVEANLMAPLVLSKAFLPGMIERGAGTIVNMSSTSSFRDPPGPPGPNGWGLGYGVTKGGLHRIAGILDVELRDRGIRAYNLFPGEVAVERNRDENTARTGVLAPPDVVGAVVAWLVAAPDAAERYVMAGRAVEAQDVCRELELLPGWPA